MDVNEDRIEEWSGVEWHTTLTGEFSSSSYVKILDTDPAVDEYMVSEKLLTYEFYVELKMNDIPHESIVYVTWPTGWNLDCTTDQYKVECTKGCEF